MMKRTFGLGALTMISACVGGGSDASDASAPPDDATFAPPPLPARDSSAPASDASLLFPDASQDAGTEAGMCPPQKTVTEADLDQNPGWKPAKAPAQLCTAAEITQFEKNLADANLKTWLDLGTDLSAGCAGCIITSTDAANWGPIVYTAASGGTDGYYNYGACFGRLSTSACGKALQYLEHCLELACDECTTTQNERDACNDTAAAKGGMCSAFASALEKECTNLQVAAKRCNPIAQAANTLCGPNADAGGGT